MLSEEEKKAIEYLKNNSREGATFWCYEAITYFVIILNLIEKQQKELNNLKEIEKSHQEENGKLRVELEEEKEKNKELEKLVFQFSQERDIILKMPVISKDKIKEKIKEREHIIHNAKLKYGQNYDIYDDVIYARQDIELYKELLEMN